MLLLIYLATYVCPMHSHVLSTQPCGFCHQSSWKHKLRYLDRDWDHLSSTTCRLQKSKLSFSLPFSPNDPHWSRALSSLLHGHVALAATWPMAGGTPHSDSRREPEYWGPTVDCCWEHTLNYPDAGLDLTLKWSRNSGKWLLSCLTEDEAGHFPMWDGWRWDIGKSGGEPS